MISAPFCHQTLTLGGKISTSIHDFIALLNEALDATFPDTERVIIKGGDYVKDIIIELRVNDCKYQYSPYDLYHQSENYEDTIEDLLSVWKRIA